MKKVLSLVLVIVIVISLVGCKGEEPNKTTGDDSSAQQVHSKKDSGDKSKQNESPRKSDDEKIQENPAQPSIKEQVILDSNDILITAKKLEITEMGRVNLSVLIENNSDQDITVYTRNSSVNGFMVYSILAEDVLAGKKSNAKIGFDTNDLEIADITTIKDIELKFSISDSSSRDNILETEIIQIATDATDHKQIIDDSGKILYDENGIKIVYKGLRGPDRYGDYDLDVYAENNKEQDITIQVRDVSLNGFMVRPIFSMGILQGKKAFSYIGFGESDLKENDITEFKSVELSFCIFDRNTRDTIHDSDPITITFD